uniref:G-protein coupled receptors family 1 profile domain-containing protein n=1 Tax=Ornithorhynchus anatinus TaxID=9258 RepID=F7AAQ7_ORNAN
EMTNVTTVTAFLLLGFSEVQELQLVHAVLFLLVYLAALVGNLLIITITTLGWCLHTPLYFFLRHLSVLDLCLISITVPKSIHNSLINGRSICFLGCVLQIFFALSSVFTELVILTVMSYNPYVAISHPLHYEVVMNRGACVKMTTASWLSWVLSAALHTASTFSFSFCGSNEMSNHTTVTEFLLLGFLEVWELQLVHATLFLLDYLVALMGNLLIITVTALDRHLHTPMYFFLRNLSVLHLIIISATIPKSIINLLTDTKSISSGGSGRFPHGDLLHPLIIIMEFVKL